MKYLSAYKDEGGVIRAWGVGPTYAQAERRADLELDAYLNEHPEVDCNWTNVTVPVDDGVKQ